MLKKKEQEENESLKRNLELSEGLEKFVDTRTYRRIDPGGGAGDPGGTDLSHPHPGRRGFLQYHAHEPHQKVFIRERRINSGRLSKTSMQE